MIPIATFHRLAPACLMPMRADRSALGTLPTAALQYCEAITSASAFGWYAFPPIDFTVQWDGTDFIWTHDGADSWFPLKSTHLPEFDEWFDANAPEDLQGFAPPFLTALPQPGVLQVWSGVMVRTRPGWSMLIRPPANIARSRDYEPYEGIIETDRWFYPLFINIRIISADRPIVFSRHRPLLQAQPLMRETYDDEALRSAAFSDGVTSLTDQDWQDFRSSLAARAKDPMMAPGRYARDVRKRQGSNATTNADTRDRSVVA